MVGRNKVTIMGIILGILIGKVLPWMLNVRAQYEPTFLVLGVVMALVVVWQTTKRGDDFLLTSTISFAIVTLLYVALMFLGRGMMRYDWGSWKYGPDEFLIALIGGFILSVVGWRWRCRQATRVTKSHSI